MEFFVINLAKIKSLPVSFNTIADQTVIPAPPSGQVNKVFGLVLGAALGTTVTIKDGAGAGTPLTGAMSLIAGKLQGFPLQVDVPYFTTQGAFLINDSAAVQVSGVVYYTVGAPGAQ
jgi:hypothetical protein